MINGESIFKINNDIWFYRFSIRLMCGNKLCKYLHSSDQCKLKYEILPNKKYGFSLDPHNCLLNFESDEHIKLKIITDRIMGDDALSPEGFI